MQEGEDEGLWSGQPPSPGTIHFSLAAPLDRDSEPSFAAIDTDAFVIGGRRGSDSGKDGLESEEEEESGEADAAPFVPPPLQFSSAFDGGNLLFAREVAPDHFELELRFDDVSPLGVEHRGFETGFCGGNHAIESYSHAVSETGRSGRSGRSSDRTSKVDIFGDDEAPPPSWTGTMPGDPSEPTPSAVWFYFAVKCPPMANPEERRPIRRVRFDIINFTRPRPAQFLDDVLTPAVWRCATTVKADTLGKGIDGATVVGSPLGWRNIPEQPTWTRTPSAKAVPSLQRQGLLPPESLLQAWIAGLPARQDTPNSAPRRRSSLQEAVAAVIHMKRRGRGSPPNSAAAARTASPTTRPISAVTIGAGASDEEEADVSRRRASLKDAVRSIIRMNRRNSSVTSPPISPKSSRNLMALTAFEDAGPSGDHHSSPDRGGRPSSEFGSPVHSRQGSRRGTLAGGSPPPSQSRPRSSATQRHEEEVERRGSPSQLDRLERSLSKRSRPPSSMALPGVAGLWTLTFYHTFDPVAAAAEAGDTSQIDDAMSPLSSPVSRASHRKSTTSLPSLPEPPAPFGEVAFFALTLPYSDIQLRTMIQGIEMQCIRQPSLLVSRRVLHWKPACCQVATVARSGDGAQEKRALALVRPCEILSFTERVPPSDPRLCVADDEVRRRRPLLVIFGRERPGEHATNWAIQGFLRFLCGRSKRASALRNAVEVICAPMLCAGGVAIGQHRSRYEEGLDVEPDWGTGSYLGAKYKEASTPMDALRRWLRETINEGRRVAAVLEVRHAPTGQGAVLSAVGVSGEDVTKQLMRGVGSPRLPGDDGSGLAAAVEESRKSTWFRKMLPRRFAAWSADVDEAWFNLTKATRRRQSLAATMWQEFRNARQDIPMFALEVPGFGPGVTASVKTRLASSEESNINYLTQCSEAQPSPTNCGNRLGVLGLALGLAFHDCLCGTRVPSSTRRSDYSHRTPSRQLASSTAEDVIAWDTDLDFLACRWLRHPSKAILSPAFGCFESSESAVAIGLSEGASVCDGDDESEEDREPGKRTDIRNTIVEDWGAGLPEDSITASADAVAAAAAKKMASMGGGGSSDLGPSEVFPSFVLNGIVQRPPLARMLIAADTPSPSRRGTLTSDRPWSGGSRPPASPPRRPFFGPATITGKRTKFGTQEYIIMCRQLESDTAQAPKMELSLPRSPPALRLWKSHSEGSLSSPGAVEDAVDPYLVVRGPPPVGGEYAVAAATSVVNLALAAEARRLATRPVFPQLGVRGKKGLPPPERPRLRVADSAIDGFDSRPCSKAVAGRCDRRPKTWQVSSDGSLTHGLPKTQSSPSLLKEQQFVGASRRKWG